MEVFVFLGIVLLPPCLAHSRHISRLSFPPDLKSMAATEEPPHKKQKIPPGIAAADRISGLPDEILRHILSLLPMDLSAASALLSRRWRPLFSSVPDLEFCNHPRSCGRGIPAGNPYNEFWLRSVLHVLSRRQEPIRRCNILLSQVPFSIHNIPAHVVYSITSAETLDWIARSLRSVGIRDLRIQTFGYLNPSHVFSCTTLQRLTLSRCALAINSVVSHLPNLKSLELIRVRATGSDIELIVSRCPALEYLKLHIRGILIEKPRICSKRLSMLEMNTANVSIEEAPRLSSVCIDLNHQSVMIRDKGAREGVDRTMVGNIVKLLQGLACVQSLKFILGFSGMRTLKRENIPLPNTLASRFHLFKLKTLFFALNPFDEYSLSALSCILASSPNLQELIIDGYAVAYSPLPWDLNSCFELVAKWPATITLHIQIIDIEYWIAFIKFLVVKASTLEKITIICEKYLKMKDWEQSAFESAQKELLLLEKASPHTPLELTINNFYSRRPYGLMQKSASGLF